MAHVSSTHTTVSEALSVPDRSSEKRQPVSAASQKLHEVAVGESAHGNRYKQPASFENRHKALLNSSDGKAFFRKSFASKEASSKSGARRSIR